MDSALNQLQGRLVDGLYPTKSFEAVTVRIREHPYSVSVPLEGHASIYVQSKKCPSFAPDSKRCTVIRPHNKDGNPVFWRVDFKKTETTVPTMIETIRKHCGKDCLWFACTHSVKVFLNWLADRFSLYIGFAYGVASDLMKSSTVDGVLSLLQVEGTKSRLFEYRDDCEEAIMIRDWQEDFDEVTLMDGSHGVNLIWCREGLPVIEEQERMLGIPLLRQTLNNKPIDLRSFSNAPYYVHRADCPPRKKVIEFLLIVSRLSQIPLVYLLKWIGNAERPDNPQEEVLEDLLVKMCERICFFLDHYRADGSSITVPPATQPPSDQNATASRQVALHYDNKFDPSPYSFCTTEISKRIEGPLIYADVKSCYPTVIAQLLPEDVRHVSGINLREVMKTLIRLRRHYQTLGRKDLSDAMKKVANTITGKCLSSPPTLLFDPVYYYHILLNGRKMTTHMRNFIEENFVFVTGRRMDPDGAVKTLLVQTDGAFFKIPIAKGVAVATWKQQIQQELDVELRREYAGCEEEFFPTIVVEAIGSMCIMRLNKYLYERLDGTIHYTKDIAPSKFWETLLHDGTQLEGYKEEVDVLNNITAKKRLQRDREEDDAEQRLEIADHSKNSEFIVYSVEGRMLIKKARGDGFVVEQVEKPRPFPITGPLFLYSSFS